VQTLLDHHKVTTDTVKAIYLDGTKKGKQVSPRSVRNLLDPRGNTAGMDIVAALAARLGVAPWQLLVPRLNPDDPPRLALTKHEVKLHKQFEQMRDALRGPERTS
jgi:hypothetical protein